MDDINEPNDSGPSALPILFDDSSLVITAGSEDVWILDIPPYQEWQITALFNDLDGDLNLQLANDLYYLVDYSYYGVNEESLTIVNDTGLTVRYFLVAYAFTGGCIPYELTVASLIPCAEDVNEPNDGIGTALQLLPDDGSLVVTTGSPDVWSFNVPAYSDFTVDAGFADRFGDIDLYVTDGVGSPLGSSVGPGANNEVVVVTNATAAPATYYATVQLSGSDGAQCNRYGLHVDCAEDGYEPNEVLAEALPIVLGDPNLVVRQTSDDWWSFDVAAGDNVEVSAVFDGSQGNLDLVLRDDTGAVVGASTGLGDREAINIANLTGATRTYYLGIAAYSGCASYELAIGPALGCVDDGANEPNETRQTALPIILGDNTLAVTNFSDDWWSYTVPAGQTFLFEVLFSDAIADVDAFLYDAGGAQVDNGETGNDNELVSHTNTTGSPQLYTLKVEIYSGTCNNYELRVADNSGCAEDANEPNDARLSALPIVLGDPDLAITSTSEDWWSFTVANNQTATLDVLFVTDLGNLDVELYDAAGVEVDDSLTNTNNEQVQIVNSSGASATYTARVFRKASMVSTCNNYELALTLSP